MDSVYKEIGELGLEQIKYLTIISIIRSYTTLHYFNYVFISQEDSFGIRSEWNLIGDRSWLLPLTFTAQGLGAMLEPPVSRLGDLYGRKVAICIFLFMMIVFNQIGGWTDE